MAITDDGKSTPELQIPSSVVAALPGPFERAAVRWDLAPRSLSRFLDDYEEMLRKAGSTSTEQWISSLPRYAPNIEVREMWEALSEAEDSERPRTWQNYRDDIIANTPGASDDDRYTLDDLADATAQYCDAERMTRSQYAEYYREMYVILENLLRAQRITRSEVGPALISGLPKQLRTRVHQKLKQRFPLARREDAWTVKTVNETIDVVLREMEYGDDSDDEYSGYRWSRGRNRGQPHARASSPAPTSTPKSKVRFYDASTTATPTSIPQIDELTAKFNSMMAAVETLAHTVAASHQQQSAVANFSNNDRGPQGGYRGYQGAGRPQGGYQTYNDAPECHFCGDPAHRVSNCPVRDDYVARNLCQIDRTGPRPMVRFNDGMLITRSVGIGRYMAEKIDNWHRARSPAQTSTSAPQPATPVVSSNILDVVESPKPQTPSPALPSLASAFIEEIAEPVPEIDVMLAFESITENELPLVEAWIQEKKRSIEASRSKPNTRSEARNQQIKAGTAKATIPSKPETSKAKDTTNSSGPASPKAQGSKSVTTSTSTALPLIPSAHQTPISTPSNTFVPIVTQESYWLTQAPSNSLQYRYLTPIEDQNIANSLVECALSSSVTLSVQELLAVAVAPNVRKGIKEKTTAKQIPVQTLIQEDAFDDPGEAQNIQALQNKHINHVEVLLTSELP